MNDPAWKSIPCVTCGAAAGEDCHLLGWVLHHTKTPHKARIPYVEAPKAKFVQLPLEPTPAILKFLAGEPLILCASDEANARAWYAKLLEIGGMKK